MAARSPASRRRAWIFAALLLWSTVSSGCSWYVVKGPPENPSRLDAQHCTHGYEIPALDAALGTLSLLLASSGVYTLAKGDGTGAAALVVGLAGAGAAGWSGYHGYRDVRRCREARTRLGVPDEPPPWSGPNP